jgi:hypothetical protein
MHGGSLGGLVDARDRQAAIAWFAPFALADGDRSCYQRSIISLFFRRAASMNSVNTSSRSLSLLLFASVQVVYTLRLLWKSPVFRCLLKRPQKKKIT